MNALAPIVAPQPPMLTHRQRATVALIAQGDSQKVAAGRLRITAAAVERRLSKARDRLGARNTPHLVSLALIFGLVEPVTILSATRPTEAG